MSTSNSERLFDEHLINEATVSRWKMWFVKLFGTKHKVKTFEGEAVYYKLFRTYYLDETTTKSER